MTRASLSWKVSALLILATAACDRAAAQEMAVPPAPFPPPPGGPPSPGPGFAAPFGPVRLTPIPPATAPRHPWGWRHRARHQHKALGYPEEFNEWPLGWSVYSNAQTQIANAAAARMVFYHYDFEDGTSRLNYRGRDKLARAVPQLAASPFPLVVERTPKVPGLDDARRLGLLAELAQGPYPVTSDRVLVGPPIAVGLSGREAEMVYQNLLIQTISGGAAIGLDGPTGGAGLDGGGLTGGGVASPGGVR